MKKIVLTVAFISLFAGTVFAAANSFKSIHDKALESIKIDNNKINKYKKSYEIFLKKSEKYKKKGNTKLSDLNSKSASATYEVIDSLNNIIKYKKEFLKYQDKVNEGGIAFPGKDMGTITMFKIPKGMKPSTRIANLEKSAKMYSEQAKTAKLKDSGSHLSDDYQNLAKTTLSIADAIKSYDKARSGLSKAKANLKNYTSANK